jgi:hypothetical protein
MESKASFVLQLDDIADVSSLFSAKSWTTGKGGHVYMRSTVKGGLATFVQRSITSPSTGLLLAGGFSRYSLVPTIIPSASNGVSDTGISCTCKACLIKARERREK